MLPYSGMVMCSLVDQRRKQKKGRNPRNNINIKSLIKKKGRNPRNNINIKSLIKKKGRNPRNNINIKSLIKKSVIGNLKTTTMSISGLREEKNSNGGKQK